MNKYPKRSSIGDLAEVIRLRRAMDACGIEVPRFDVTAPFAETFSKDLHNAITAYNAHSTPSHGGGASPELQYITLAL